MIQTRQLSSSSLMDAHCHLQDITLRPHLDAVLQRARQTGVERMHVCGTGETDWAMVREIAANRPEIVISLGLHPWQVMDRSPDWLDRLKDQLAQQPCGIGEIGLDRALDMRNDEDQESIFRAQLSLSYDLNLPASIHCRKAWEPLLRILEEFGPHPAGLLVHSYSGADEIVPRLAALNVYFSFSGSITRPENKRGRRAAAVIPEDRLLIESDAPDIMPVLPTDQTPWLTDDHGKALSEPAYLPLMLNALATIRNTAPAQLADRIGQNARRLFAEILP